MGWSTSAPSGYTWGSWSEMKVCVNVNNYANYGMDARVGRGSGNNVVDRLTKNTFRCERYTVTTAPNGTKIGVTLPMGTKEIFLPYSQEVSNATAGTQVLVVWWGSMSNAKVYYYANGYDGPQPFDPLSKVYPVGSIYMSSVNVSPALPPAPD